MYISLLPPVDPSQRVMEVSKHWWYSMLIQPPLLKDSVAAPLLSAYYPDCVGMSPSCTSTHRATVTATTTATGSASPAEMEPSKAAPSSLGERCSGTLFLPSLGPLLGNLRVSKLQKTLLVYVTWYKALLHAFGYAVGHHMYLLCIYRFSRILESYMGNSPTCIHYMQVPYYRLYCV